MGYDADRRRALRLDLAYHRGLDRGYLDPLPGHPRRTALCVCEHHGADHSHILIGEPCLMCECFGFIFDREATLADLRIERRAG